MYIKYINKDINLILINFFPSTGDHYNIPVTHEALTWSLFVDTLNINFDNLRFKRQDINELSICNESHKDAVFHMDFITKEDDTSADNLQNDITKYNSDKFAFRHFEIKPKCATIPPNFSYTVQIIFRPIMHKDFILMDDDLPPFKVVAGVKVFWKDECGTQEKQICLKGEIMSPEIEIKPGILDLRQVYFGEEHCMQIKVINNDGKVKFK